MKLRDVLIVAAGGAAAYFGYRYLTAPAARAAVADQARAPLTPRYNAVVSPALSDLGNPDPPAAIGGDTSAHGTQPLDSSPADAGFKVGAGITRTYDTQLLLKGRFVQ
jgi:hypothetical protein